MKEYTVLDWGSIWVKSLAGLALAGLVYGCLIGALAVVALIGMMAIAAA